VRQLHDKGFVVATLGYESNDMLSVKEADVSFVRLGRSDLPVYDATFLSINEEDNFGSFMQTISMLKQEEGGKLPSGLTKVLMASRHVLLARC